MWLNQPSKSTQRLIWLTPLLGIVTAAVLVTVVYTVQANRDKSNPAYVWLGSWQQSVLRRQPVEPTGLSHHEVQTGQTVRSWVADPSGACWTASVTFPETVGEVQKVSNDQCLAQGVK